MNVKALRVIALVAFASLILGGCKTTEPLYYYGGYQQSVYNYFNANEVTVTEQIQSLEKIIAKSSAKGKTVAPGVHAHLGMLYFEIGNTEQGAVNFEYEKALFPESIIYLDFLIKNSQGE